MNNVIHLPWMLVEDFNELEFLSDKQGCTPPSLYRTNRLNSFMTTTSVESIVVNGKPFTWKKCINGSWVFEKLDRGIAHEDRITVYPNLRTTYGSFTFSDHCPIIITTEPTHRLNVALPFRFQNFWIKYQQLDSIVTKTWKISIKGTKMFQFSRKLKALKNNIKT